MHGLGVNPGDGALYVATHHGTFRIPEGGSAERVGSSSQDTMGFTVAGPDRFLGSGHPDVAGMQAGQPGLLGLIESSDAGRSWVSRSLSGEVDFHALAFAHGQVYGWDATSARLMVSADAQVWETRTQMPMHSFAVDPADPDRLVAAMPGGLRSSSDGGRMWSRLLGPELVLVSWAPDGVLWGLAQDGAVLRSSDGGEEWESAGHLPGDAQALSATSEAVWAAAAADGEPTGIYRSRDGGSPGSWSTETPEGKPRVRAVVGAQRG
ncbi:MAG: exo-alpha-sialidase [Acidimicrobiia bacterium]|nr:exo-alpha-sialidase [Acidimicrobiia bacterium]